jgi:hypothetical protein
MDDLENCIISKPDRPIDRYYAKAQCTQKRVEYERNRSKPSKLTLKL